MSLDKPAIGVGVVVFWEQHVLLIQRARPPKAGSWSIPGGKQELGETLRAAAIREVMEETGLALKEHDLRLLDAVDLIELPHFHYSLIDFYVSCDGGNLTAGSDAANCAWVALTDLSRYDLWDKTEALIHKAYDQIKS